MTTANNEPQTQLEEIRITKETDPDLYAELKNVIPKLVKAKDALADLRKNHISDAKAVVDSLMKEFKEIVTREKWGTGDDEDVIRFESYQIKAKMSEGHDVRPSVSARVKRVE